MPVAYQKQFGQYQALAAKAHESIKNSIFVQIPDTGHIRIWKARTSSTRMSFRFSRGRGRTTWKKLSIYRIHLSF
jgi:hypothetical protein